MANGWQVRQGDALERMREMPDESVQVVVSSPPYWNQRDYDVAGQLGLEPTPEDYVAQLVEVFREVRRVLRADGTVWLNLGDCYADRANRRSDGESFRQDRADVVPRKLNAIGNGRKRKDLVGLPWMVAFALRDDGWWLRQENIWHKRSGMPESARDRPHRAHEQLFLLAKSERYYYDEDAVVEPYAPSTASTWGSTRKEYVESEYVRAANWGRGVQERRPRLAADGQPRGASRRSVWEIAAQPSPEEHYATFPADLAEPCILLSTAVQACSQCGAPWLRKTERIRLLDGVPQPAAGAWSRPDQPRRAKNNGIGHRRWQTVALTLGCEPGCEHDDGDGRCVVLDPFCGTGTAGRAAVMNGREFIGIDLSEKSCRQARRQIRGAAANPSGRLRRAAPIPESGQLELVGDEED